MADPHELGSGLEGDTPAQPAAAPIDADRPCLRCGYNLHGLTTDARCPECGTPVNRSLQGNLLLYSATDYVASLNLGSLLILIAVILQILGMFVSLGMLVITLGTATGAYELELLVGFMQLGFGGLALVGWWMFSRPDEAIIGFDTGDTPRKVVRGAVIITAAAMVGSLLATALGDGVVEAIGGFVVGVAGIVLFFASLLYIRWLAPRLPSPEIERSAKQYMWLLPLIYIVGACLIVGPLIAAVMYYFLINRVRIRLAQILAQQRTMEPQVLS